MATRKGGTTIKAKKDDVRELIAEVRKLRKGVESSNSLGRRFSLGIITGVGSAIGSLLIAGIFFYFLAQFLADIGIEPFLTPTGSQLGMYWPQ